MDLTAWLRKVGGWIAAALGAALLAVFGLWRRSERKRADAESRAESAAGSVKRTETLRVDETKARADADAARATIATERADASRRMEVARDELRRVPDSGLAAEVERRRKAGRLP